MGKIRVLNVITRLEPGGAPLALLDAIRRLSADCFDVVLATGQPDDPALDLRNTAHTRGIKLIPVPSMRRDVHLVRDLLAFCSLVRIIRSGRYHIVHTHTSKAGLLGRLAARICGAPAVIHSPHGTVLEGYFDPLTTRFFAALERLAAPWADRIVCLTDMEIGQYLRARIGRRKQYTRIHNGIDITAFSGSGSVRGPLRRDLGLAQDHTVCITVGRLVPVKGHADLLHAFSRAASAHSELRLLIAGDGPLGQELEDLAAQLEISDLVRFLAWRDDVPDLLDASDIFVLPSHNEGLGLVIVEAMAKRLPVVATSVGGVPEVVVQGRTGLLVPARSPDEFADAVSLLASDPGRRIRMGEAGRSRAVEQFSIHRTVRQTELLYLELTGATS